MERRILFRSLRRLPCASLYCHMTFLFFTSFYYFANSSACLCSAVLTLKLIRQKKDIRGRYCFHSQTNPPTASNENCATITAGVACIFIFLYLVNYSEVKKKVMPVKPLLCPGSNPPLRLGNCLVFNPLD